MNHAVQAKTPSESTAPTVAPLDPLDGGLNDPLSEAPEAQLEKASVQGKSSGADNQTEQPKESGLRARFVNGFKAMSKRVRKGFQSIGDKRRKGVRSDAHNIPTKDIVYEQLAHAGAYGKLDNSKLAAWGYQEAQVIDDTATGFRGVLYTPTAASLGSGPDAAVSRAIHGGAPAPVVALRGTANMKGVQDDVNKQGVGSYQFRANRGTIAGMLSAAGGGAVVCGHSLGGALAQLTAVHLSGVARVVTFQSPGISKDDADAFKAKQAKAAPEDRITSTHYRKDGDIVHAAGDDLTEGDVYRFHSQGIDNPFAHTHFPLARLNQARGGLVPGITGKGQEAASDDLTRVTKSTTGEEKGDFANRFSESGRKVLGGLVRKDSQDTYTKLWKNVRLMAESGTYSAQRIEAVIEAADGISINQKARMRTQAHQLLEASS